MYLIMALQQKLCLFNFALGNVKSYVEEPYYKMAEQSRDKHLNKFIQR